MSELKPGSQDSGKTALPIVDGARTRASAGVTTQITTRGVWYARMVEQLPLTSKSAETLSPPICPRCGNPMVAGYIAFGGRANWVGTLGMLDAAPGVGDTIVGNLDHLVRIPHIRAWRCTKCGLALLDYGAGPVFTPW
jgi:hypothetical protein